MPKHKVLISLLALMVSFIFISDSAIGGQSIKFGPVVAGSINLGGDPLQGAVNVIVESAAATDSVTEAEMTGSFFIARFATGPMVYDLPTAVVGENACFFDEEGDGITLVPLTGDRFILNGVTLDVLDTIDSPGVAGGAGTSPGSFICILAIDVDIWITLGRAHAWIDAGAE